MSACLLSNRKFQKKLYSKGVLPTPSFAGLSSALTHDTNSLVKYCRCLQDKKDLQIRKVKVVFISKKTVKVIFIVVLK